MSAAAIAGAQAASATLPTGDLGNKVKAGLWIAIGLAVVIIIIIAVRNGSKIFGDISGSIDSVLETLHLKKSVEEQAADAAAAAADPVANSVSSPFNPTFFKTAPAGTKLLTSGTLVNLASQIYHSVGYFIDNPESGYGAFKQCSNWCQVSQLADMFNQQYGKDVYAWLKIKYDTTSQKDVLAKIVQYCVSLPKYS